MPTIEPIVLPAPDEAKAWIDSAATAALERAREMVADLREAAGLDALGALTAWNDLSIELSNISAVASTFSELHVHADVRERSDAASADVAKLWTQIGLDRGLYDVFAGVDPAGLDQQAARLHEKILRDFRRSGVDKDDATRERIQELSEQMVLIGQQFAKNIRDDVREVRVSPDRLGGMPQDWVDAHPPGDDGLVTVTTDYPDSVPVSTFAEDAQLRRDLRVASLNRGWPVNDAVLQELFALRREYAALVGYDSWADYNAETKMIKDGSAIIAFINQIAEAARDSAARDYERLLERMRRDRPDATVIDAADAGFYGEVIRREEYDVDAQLVRTYFDFEKVRAGLLDVTGRLFGLRYEPAADAVTWHADIAAYDVLSDDAGERIGRIYLDLHPREGKYKHAAQFDLVNGVTGRQLPEGVLACNFSRGMMEHSDVVTLFHEFGHLLHHVIGGAQQWVRYSGVATEWDFVEAPSQMLEEWAWDPAVLATFATNSSGEPIPADLVRKMKAADDFGKGYYACTQMFYASMSYDFHVQQVADLTERTRELQQKYSVFPFIDGTHMAASFGHLDGYSSGYYTYMWSLVIAKDMFSQFDESDLLATPVAHRYRDEILAPGGSRDAADLVESFLGRPYSFDAFAQWLAT